MTLQMKGTKQVQAGDVKVGDVVVGPLGGGSMVTKIERTVTFTCDDGEGWATDPEWIETIAINPEDWG